MRRPSHCFKALIMIFPCTLSIQSVCAKGGSSNNFDLDDDGIKETLVKVRHISDRRHITIKNLVLRTKIVDFEMAANKTSFDDVEINSAGGLSIYSGCDICGRETYVTEYKVAYRKGEYIVAGYTLSEADRQTATFSSCDVNLLTGDAELMVDDETVRRKGKDRYFNVAQLSYSYKPEVCDDI